MSGRVVRLKEVEELTGLSRSAIYDRLNKKSRRYESSFPRQFSLGGKAVGWLKHEIDTWVANCAAQQRGGRIPDAEAGGTSAKVISAPARQGRQPVYPPQKPRQLAMAHASEPLTLADVIVEGQELIEVMRGYLALEEWTPAMGAMFAAGLSAAAGCAEIPNDGLKDFMGRSGQGIGIRYCDAKRILREYEFQDNAPRVVHPTEFLAWCVEEDVETVWTGLFNELLGAADPQDAAVTNARISMFLAAAIGRQA